MKKVMLVYDCLLSEKNGANTVINQIVGSEYLKKNGILVEAFSPDKWIAAGDVNSTLVKKSTLKSKIKSTWLFLTKYSTLATSSYLFFISRIAKRIALSYIATNPKPSEVAFFHTLYPCYYYLKNRKTIQPTVLVMHTSGDTFKMFRTYYRALERSYYYRWLLKMEEYVLQNVDRISFVAETSMNEFIKTHPYIDTKKISFIYNGVADETTLNTARKKGNVMEICCVASISRRKGQYYIIEALKRFNHATFPNVHFTFVGDGNDRKDLQIDVHHAGLDKYVSFVGVSQEVDKYLGNSDAYILPSEDEGLPMAIIEAMRANLPIVATPVGGIPEMVKDGYNGIIIQPSIESVYCFLSNLDTYNWHEMGKNARKVFEEKFTVKRMLDGYLKLLDI